MALQKQNITIPLGVGLDTKTEPKQVEVGKLTVLENAVFTKVKQVQHRFGITPLLQTIITGGSISSGKMVTSLGNDLIMADGQKLYSYSGSAADWVNRGDLVGATIQSTGVARDVIRKESTDSATANGFTIIAWDAWDFGSVVTGGTYATVIDNTTKTVVVSAVKVSTGTGLNQPRCSAANGNFYVHYRDNVGGFIYVRTISSTNPVTFTAEAIVAADFNISSPPSFQTMEVCQSGTDIVLAYSTNPTGLKIGILNAAGTFSATTATYTDTPSGMALISYSNSDAVNDGIYLVYHTDATIPGFNIFVLIYNLTLSNAPAPIIIPGVPLIGDYSIGLAQLSATSVQVYISRIDFSLRNNGIYTGNITRAGVPTAFTNYIFNLNLYSKPIVINGSVYLVATFSGISPIQPAYFLLTGTIVGILVNRISYQNAGETIVYTCTLSTITSIEAGVYGLSNTVKTSLPTESTLAVLSSNSGVQHTRIDFAENKLWDNAEAGKQKYIAAGMLNQYDGQNIVETGFHLYPERWTPIAGAAGAVFVAGQTYSYSVIYEWINANGDIERSSPGIPVRFTPGVGLANIGISRIPYLNITKKQNVQVCIYRTIGNGTTYYKVGTELNDPTLNDFTFTDTAADSTIVDNELLYTTGGVFDNIPPPSCSSITQYKGRIVAVGLEDENEVWFSKQYRVGEVPGFSDSFIIRIDQGTLGVKSVGVLDDKLVFFKSNEIFVTAGNGPLPTGAQNDFQDPISVAADVGCPYPKSVVETPLGLMFKSLKGFYLLDRSLRAAYIGAAVEEFNTLTVTSSVLLEKVNQVRFTHSDGSCIVYDYFFEQWSTFINYTSVGSCSRNGTYAMVRSNGVVNLESTTSYLDNGVAVPIHITTPWIQTGGIEGFQRVYSAMFQGTKNSNHTITIKVGYDFDPSWAETFVFDTSVITTTLEELLVRPARQKCTAIRFDIADSNPLLVDGAGLSLASLTLQVGIKGGTNKIPAARVVPAT